MLTPTRSQFLICMNSESKMQLGEGYPTLGRTNLQGETELVLTKGLVETPCNAEFICLTPSSTRQRTSSEEEEMSRIQPVISMTSALFP